MSKGIRSHIVFSAEPLKEGNPVSALCGEEVLNSVFTFKSLGGKPDETWGNTILFCNKCIGKLIVNFPSVTYVYGCRTRQDRDGDGVEAA